MSRAPGARGVSAVPPETPEPLAARVYAALADGRFRSGAELARQLGVTRSAVWKAARALRALGVSVHAVRNRGYRLPEVAAPLDADRIRGALSATVRERVRGIETVWCLPSTNAVLLERPDRSLYRADVLLAEYQSAGRGRRGRTWLAPPGGAICLSLSWCFAQLPRDLGALGLAVGVCALRALQPRVAAPLRLKWPNDLVVEIEGSHAAEARKLAGILIELRAEASGPTFVVIGIGVNIVLGKALLDEIAATGTRATDLKSLGVAATERNTIVAALLEAIVPGLLAFEHDGLQPFSDEWVRADALRGSAVTVHSLDERTHGVARGIDASGALLIETPQGLQRFVSGDVTVRAQR